MIVLSKKICSNQEKNDFDEFADKYPSTASKKRVSHVTESTCYLAQRKHVTKKNLPSPSEVSFLGLESQFELNV